MMTLENTTGYTKEQLDELNDEFAQRFYRGDWPTDNLAEAEQWFADEVARRNIRSEAARQMGRAKSPRKAESSNANGRKGGRPRLVWSSDKDWTSAHIFSGPKGWRIETYSLIQGETTGKVVFVPYSERFPVGMDMDADWNEHTSNASALIHFCENEAGSRVLKAGRLVE